jgi:hypothetical protein
MAKCDADQVLPGNVAGRDHLAVVGVSPEARQAVAGIIDSACLAFQLSREMAEPL